MKICLFGGISVIDGGSIVTQFPTRRAGALLAYLAYHRDQRHPRELVAEVLWPGGNPDSIRLRLNQAVSEVRQTLRGIGDPFISDRLSLQLRADVETDVAEFRRLIQLSSSIEQSRAAIELCDEPLLPGVYEDWATEAREALDADLVPALRRLSEDACNCADWNEGIRFIRKWIATDPYAEDARERLVEVQLKAGRRADAEKTYQEYRSWLHDQFAATPSPRLQSLVGSAPKASVAASVLDYPVGRKDDVLDTYLATGAVANAMRYVTARLPYWHLRGEYEIGRDCLHRVMTHPGASSAPPLPVGWALLTMGMLATSCAKYHEAEAAFSRSLGLAERCGDQQLMAEVEAARGMLCGHRRMHERSLTECTSALARFERLEDKLWQSNCHTGIGEAHRFLGDLDAAEESHRRALFLREELGRFERVAHSTLNLGIVANRRCRFRESLPLLRSALVVLREHGSRLVLADTLMEIACAYGELEMPTEASRLLGAVVSLRDEIMAPIPLCDKPDYVRFVCRARGGLTREHFAQEWDRGKEMPIEEAIGCAMG